MPGGNPSAESAASTDPGGSGASPFRYLLAKSPYRERHKSAKSWGCGARPLQIAPATNASVRI